MLTIRPVRDGDAAALARLLQPVMPTARPTDLHAVIAESRQALDGDGPVPHRLVLVLEDSAAALLGAITLAGSTGLDLPRASYRTGTVVHASAELKMFHRAPTLLLCNDLSGCAELGPPVMADHDDAQPLQRLLVDAALMFVAAHRDRFAARLVAQLPGIGGAHGASPFWRGLGRHFHAAALPQDTAFFPSAERSHIARLMPKHPLYSALLGPDAQACIARHAASAQALAEALHAQGLRHRGQVNLFDAGPVLEAEVGDLAAVRGSRICQAVVVDESHGEKWPVAAQACLTAPHGAVPDRDWRACLVSAVMDDGVARLGLDIAAALGLQPGQRIRMLGQTCQQ